MTELDTIMSDRQENRDQPEPQVQDQGQHRDEQGRFAERQQPDQPVAEQPVPEAAKPPEGYVPIQALDARLSKQEQKYQEQLREQAQAFERRLAALQQPKAPEPTAPKVPFIEALLGDNGEAAIDSRLQQMVQPLQTGQQQIVENFSRMMASDKFGEDTVNAALADMTARVNANPQAMRFDYQRIMSAPHPYGELVKWHKAQTALGEIGDDPKAYREKLRAEILAEMNQGGQQPAPQAPAAPAAMPQSFTTARSPGSGAAPQFSGPVPLSELMGR